MRNILHIPASPTLRHIGGKSLVVLGLFAASLAVGFAVTFPGVHTWDDFNQLRRSHFLVKYYGFVPLQTDLRPQPPIYLEREVNNLDKPEPYSPLWDLIFGLADYFVFRFLKDPYWVLHALTFALVPICSLLLYYFLRFANISRSTALLGCMCILGNVRLIGHAQFHSKDVPVALVSVVVAVIIWVLWQRSGEQRSVLKEMSMLFLAGVLSILPFLLRMPLLLPFVLLCGGVAFQSVFPGEKTQWTRRILRVAMPLAGGALPVVLLFPKVWAILTPGAANSLTMFASFPWKWEGGVRLFGQIYNGTDWPWWMPFSWFPIGASPALLIVATIGVVLHVFTQTGHTTQGLLYRISRCSIKISLQLWLWIIAVAGFAAVALQHPTLYDDDRHLLFLYPVATLFALLGLNRLPARIKMLCVAGIVVSSMHGIIGWNRYAYIYISPFFPNLSITSFMGDYSGACLSEAVSKLPQYVTSPFTIVVDGQDHEAMQQLRRFNTLGSLTYDPAFAGYTLIGGRVPEWGDIAITANSIRSPRYGETMKRFTNDQIALLWTRTLPNGEQVCAIADYRR
jgi:hypothetical protein